MSKLQTELLQALTELEEAMAYAGAELDTDQPNDKETIRRLTELADKANHAKIVAVELRDRIKARVRRQAQVAAR